MKIKVAAVLLASLLYSPLSMSATDRDVTITGVGCGQDGTCFANVSPAVSQNCNNNNQVRWNGNTGPGRNFTASALTARAANITVNVGTIDGQCSGNFPVVNFITVAG